MIQVSRDGDRGILSTSETPSSDKDHPIQFVLASPAPKESGLSIKNKIVFRI